MARLSLSDHRHNLALNVFHESTWGFGIAFHDSATILPLFLIQLGAPLGVVGSLAGLFAVLFSFPQLISALLGRNIRNIKAATVGVHILIWPPIFIAGFTFAFIAPAGPSAWIFYYICFIFYALSIGFVLPIWGTFIREVTKRKNRGTFLGISFVGNSIGGFAGGLAVKSLLTSRIPFPNNFGWGFLITFASIAVGTLVFLGYRLRTKGKLKPHRSVHAFFAELKQILTQNKNFRAYLVSRIFLTAQMPAISLYAVHAQMKFNFDISEAGLLTSAKVVAFGFGSFLGGKIGDRAGHKTGMVFASFCSLSALIIALFSQSMLWVYGIFIFLGLGQGAFMPCALSLIYDFAGEKGDNKIYMALIDSILAPFVLLGIILSGALATFYGIEKIFITIGLIFTVGIIILIVKVRDPQPEG
ncbi:MAG: MFS transporter [Candidatus Neomarinimicrobiota bacterium]